MTTCTIALRDAKARLSELTDRAAEGEEIVISKHGRPVARLLPVKSQRKAVNLKQLRALTDAMPRQAESAGSWLSTVRDQARY